MGIDCIDFLNTHAQANDGFEFLDKSSCCRSKSPQVRGVAARLTGQCIETRNHIKQFFIDGALAQPVKFTA